MLRKDLRPGLSFRSTKTTTPLFVFVRKLRPFVNSGNYGKETRENFPLLRDLGAVCCFLTRLSLNRHNAMRNLNVVRPCATEKKWHLLARKLKIGSFGERETLSVNPLVIARVHVLVVTTKNVIHAFFCQHTFPVSKQVHNLAVSHANSKRMPVDGQFYYDA